MLDFTYMKDIDACASQVKIHGGDYHAALKSLILSYIKANYSGQLQDNLIVIIENLDTAAKQDFVKGAKSMDVLKSVRLKKETLEIDRLHKAYLSMEAFDMLNNMTSCNQMEKYLKSVLSVFKEKKITKPAIVKILDLLDELALDELDLLFTEVDERIKNRLEA